jgi:hypothetical protein
MKRGCPEHPKTEMLQSLLNIGQAQAVGHLELLFHFAARFAIRGDIGKWTDAVIAQRCAWKGDPAQFISAMIEVGYFEISRNYRLIIHDWEDHADQSVCKTLKNRKETFASNRGRPRELSGNIPESVNHFGDTLPAPRGKAVCPSVNGESTILIRQKFLEWIAPWPRVDDQDMAAQLWSSMVQISDYEKAFAARERYLDSAEVKDRGICQEPKNFISKQVKCGWTGKWIPCAASKQVSGVPYKVKNEWTETL